jgi:hypothetical protein
MTTFKSFISRKKKVKKLYKNRYLNRIRRLRTSIPNWDDLFVVDSIESRINQLIRIEVLGKPLCEEFSWAIPDYRALKILQNFSPLIEIGCGNNYWGWLLKQMSNKILVGFDKCIETSCWDEVHRGGPEVLKEQKYRNHNLFLCYPDENESLAIQCLENYTGEFILHVGELFVTGGTLSYPQCPWGRTTSSDFQVALAEDFHCVLMAPIPRFPFSSDCISVWKRTKWVIGKQSALGRDPQNIDIWASIPSGERLDYTKAAPFLSYLI